MWKSSTPTVSAEDAYLSLELDLPEGPRPCYVDTCGDQGREVIPNLHLCTLHIVTVLRECIKVDRELTAKAEARVASNPPRGGECVYYVRFADHIKIGRSKSLKGRMMAMHLHPDSLLAAEPGGHQIEKQRHLMFRDERVQRTELFHPSDRLLEHVEHVRKVIGDPKQFL